jgi:hypothetical protein
MCRRLGADAIDKRAPQRPGLPRPGSSVTRELGVGRWQVGRVGHDQVEPRSMQRIEQVTADRAHGDAVELGVDPGGEHRAPGYINGDHAGPGAGGSENSEHPAPSAEVEHSALLLERLPAQLLREHPAIAMWFKYTGQAEEAHILRSIRAVGPGKLRPL